MNKQEIICHTPNISIPHSAMIHKMIFSNTKGNNIQQIYFLQNKLFRFVKERHCTSSCFNLLAFFRSLAER